MPPPSSASDVGLLRTVTPSSATCAGLHVEDARSSAPPSITMSPGPRCTHHAAHAVDRERTGNIEIAGHGPVLAGAGPCQREDRRPRQRRVEGDHVAATARCAATDRAVAVGGEDRPRSEQKASSASTSAVVSTTMAEPVCGAMPLATTIGSKAAAG